MKQFFKKLGYDLAVWLTIFMMIKFNVLWLGDGVKLLIAAVLK